MLKHREHPESSAEPARAAPAAYVLLLALSTSNVSGSTKKSISAGAIFVGYCVGNIIGPYTVFIDERAVKYRSTWIALYAALGGVCRASLLHPLFLLLTLTGSHLTRTQSAPSPSASSSRARTLAGTPATPRAPT